ncbi:hypothetical protein ASD24_15340 [Paenibacillus sp. Root52]|uniref:DUF1593 domain-containing protein n=1 Tax=Paenibacillus amylolyticus TaxID=1451 RepID=A0AAP5LN70_PAEAM|nr:MULTISPECIES: DUF1593 domain-containing protein [Paenibacillus]KQY82747.1 hypothetical protein ASD24_15340 [Paenibacillus sp. Root52]MDR6723350.1 hypothetical protein [Paenibacillus amylolyticus]
MNKKTGFSMLAALLACMLIMSGCTSTTPQASDNQGNQATEQEGNQPEQTTDNEKQKARTVITTDGEVDDMNSVIRYLYYANEMDLAGIVLTSSVYHYAGDKEAGIEPFRWTGTQWLYDMLDAYEEIYPNLSTHADGYPKPEEIRAMTKIGNISDKGEMEKETEGSEFLKTLFLDDDSRDLVVQTWGGTNTTARALKSIEEQYKDTAEWANIQKKVSDKLLLYIILDQDDSYNEYIAKNWPDIRILNDQSNFWHFAYAWKMHAEEVNSKLHGDWMSKNLLNGHGKLMDMYATMGDGKMIEGELAEEQRGSADYLKNNPQYDQYDFISEGDSPSFFYLIDNGLRSMEDPSYGGWGGRFGVVNDKLYRNNVLDYDPYSKRYEAEYSLMRWFDDIQNDFAARADWGVTDQYENANHNPTLTIKEGLDLTAAPGEELTLHAEGQDPDGDQLTYKWWRYFEADTYQESKEQEGKATPEMAGDLQLGLQRPLAKDEKLDELELQGNDTDTVTFKVPEDAQSGDTLHIIAEVQDDGEHNLKHYQRVIVTVQ